jgi:LysM repeat protein
MAAGSLAAGVILCGSLIASATGAISYTILPGDTLSQIALDNGASVDDLAELNEIENPDLIVMGDKLMIPSADGGDAEIYLVQEGDTLSEIALSFGVAVEDLAALNGIENVDLIVTGDEIAVPLAVAEEEPATGEATDDAAGDDAAEDATAEADATATEDTATDDATDDASDDAGEGEGDATVDADAGTSSGAAVEVAADDIRLHLVVSGETLGDIAAEYDVTTDQIVAANALLDWEIPAGTILKIPAAGTTGIQLSGMPTAMERWPVASEIAAVTLATSYWGSTLPAQTILDALPESDNPHEGFRGSYQGMWGTTDDYGVYSAPLAEVLMANGFQADAFYADGDPSALTGRLSAGLPVVAWVTYELSVEEPQAVETETGQYTLVPNQHAVVVYGYDDAGVYAVDVASGEYVHYGWDEFMRSWSYFDGMGLAVSR